MKKLILLTVTGLVLVNLLTSSIGIQNLGSSTPQFIAEDEIYPHFIAEDEIYPHVIKRA